ncbi:hypothetical protein BDW72DRAFT_124751 [Aspergillus terricola var. indicus]
MTPGRPDHSLYLPLLLNHEVLILFISGMGPIAAAQHPLKLRLCLVRRQCQRLLTHYATSRVPNLLLD